MQCGSAGRLAYSQIAYRKDSARFFNYLIWWVKVRVCVVVRVWVRVRDGARVRVGVGLVMG